MQDYSFKSEGIIKILEDLLSDFKETKKDIDAAEVKSIAEFDKLMQALTSEKKDLENDLGKAKEAKGATIAKIAEKSGDLTTTSATLLDDQEYLKELAVMCEEKAKTWDQRSKMRADELSALTEAIAIVKGVVAKKTTEKTVRLVQRHASLGAAMIVAHSEEDMEAIEAASEADDDAAANAGVSFLQLRQPRALLSQIASKTAAQSSDAPEQDKRAQVLALLRSESQTLKSTLLADLASRVAADPFAKIKKLIQELIERLLQEAADEANHKGWCDKEMSAAKQARTYQAENIAKLNARLATAEATTARSSLRSYTSRLFTKKPTDDRTASRARVADAR